MSEAAAEIFPPSGPRSVPRWRSNAARVAARALFESTVAPDDGPRPAARPQAAELAVSLSELRHAVALQADQLERAMQEVEGLTRRLDRTRARAAAAEAGVARERKLRARQNTDAGRRLAEHEQTIALLSTELRRARERHDPAGGQRIELLERQLQARARFDERAGELIARARQAVGLAREEVVRGRRRIAALEAELQHETRARAALERRLDKVGDVAPSEVASACRRLEQELAARQALEVRAARLIGRLHHELGPQG